MDEQPSSYHDYQCPTCGRLFPHEGNLILHTDRMHSGARGFPCTYSECHKTFPSRELLRKHIRNTHQSVRLKCSTCDMVYSTNSALRRHERVHSNIRRYTCPRCGVGFDLE
ncbi:GDNF-inducible zinc finger protein 1 [Parelaphostrongylus tenuis]|uniref:GDNF-inducible zinc finger protein 1 n=1 Tax=Parelaphostrongylus tenuis TaxID=148309 RepID=A0AAD5R1M2_PARTN|nr:GDNF-inducible zinc finger protein 1 [Parelaphostrongylus tenuis]